MPDAMERDLKRTANRQARRGRLHKKPGETTAEAKDRYVYGTMRKKAGWVPSTQRKAAGRM